jgi:DnaJ-class molecular chaperone
MKWLLVAAVAYFLFPWVKRTIARGKERSEKRSRTFRAPPRPTAPAPIERSPREVLGVSATASDDEIRRAFRKLAREVHPDTFATSTPEKQALAERRFREINDAFHELSAKR